MDHKRHFDLIIRNATVIDGTKAPRYRGEIAYADITIFNAETIIDAADFRESTRPAAGIDTVIVNGVPIWRYGKPTGARPGRVLTRSARR